MFHAFNEPAGTKSVSSGFYESLRVLEALDATRSLDADALGDMLLKELYILKGCSACSEACRCLDEIGSRFADTSAKLHLLFLSEVACLDNYLE